MSEKIMLSGENDAPLFTRGDACPGPAVLCIATQAYLDENEYFPLATDQVDFTAATVEITRQDSESAFFEKARGSVFGAVADHFARFARGIVGAH
jgi:hypothetical protein